jgi:hypothetical protein
VIAALPAIAMFLGDVLTADVEIARQTESERADERLQRAFPDDRNTQERDISQVVVVVRATQGGIAAPVAEQRCRRWRATGATAVVTSTDGQPLISRDGDVDARPAPQSTAIGAAQRETKRPANTDVGGSSPSARRRARFIRLARAPPACGPASPAAARVARGLTRVPVIRPRPAWPGAASARPRRRDPRSGARCRCRPERGGALAAAARDEQDGERGDQGAASADQEGDLEAGVLGEPVRQDVGGDDAAGDLRADG